MARARNIKPDFFKNEHLAQCEHGARLLFIGLWCLADREGLLEDRPLRIKAELFPYESPDINHWLNDLQKQGFIVRYLVKNCKYIQIVNFKKHQNPHVKEQASTIPAPDLHHASPADSLNLIPDSPSDNRSTDVDRFPEFWSEYPKHVKKKPSREIWKRKKLDGHADKILKDISERLSSDCRWREGFIPDPTTYLNQERWDDEIDTGGRNAHQKPPRQTDPRSRVSAALDDWLKQSDDSASVGVHDGDFRREVDEEARRSTIEHMGGGGQ